MVGTFIWLNNTVCLVAGTIGWPSFEVHSVILFGVANDKFSIVVDTVLAMVAQFLCQLKFFL